MNKIEPVSFEDLFNLSDIQRLQDEFALATGVASIITRPDGRPLTAPSNFCRLCREVIRGTEQGRLNCFKSDAALGQWNAEGPTIQPCLSGGLWDAGAAISVGGTHIASWLIGQVRDETQTEEQVRDYARRIGADEKCMVEAFDEVPAMSRERFGQIARMLFTLANQLSNTAYQNVQQARHIAEREKFESELQESQRVLATLMSNLPGMAYRCRNDAQWTMVFVSDGCREMTGYKPAELIDNDKIGYADLIHEQYREGVQRAVASALSRKEPFELTYRIQAADGVDRWVWERGRGVFDANGRLLFLEGFISDITEHRMAEAERDRLEAQLQHSQKMEAVGRLAGGVAHDFNNMLSVILGNAEMALYDLEATHPLYGALREIQNAAERSANLTRQLLAYARRQTISPRVLDLNETVDGALKMLHRIIGEDIELKWIPGGELWPIHIDPSQIDQILANLCANARHAITGIGKITIETENVCFDEIDIDGDLCVRYGEYVLLAVSDNGVGMSSETQAHIFEPFYTTKNLGEGTGLGLATVYGIISQNNGFINVCSEPGHGSTFRLYLPRYVEKAGRPAHTAPAEPAQCGHETILLVEDEPAILKLGKIMLENLGYKVYTAQTPGQAIEQARAHAGQIDLLITDVVMPEMNGRDLAGKLLSLYPGMKRIFMSGYTANVIAHHGILDEGVHFIQKPFSRRDMAVKVREILDTI